MTLIASWASLDNKPKSKSVSAIYIGTDSRFSWPDGRTYDGGQKTFFCLNSPEIFGYCGDVTFPLNALNQLVILIDSNCLFDPDASIEEKLKEIAGFLHDAWTNYPSKFSNSTIIYGTRCGKDFHVFTLKTVKDGTLIVERQALPDISSIIVRDGSGKIDFDSNWSVMNSIKSDNFGTSRNVFFCLSESIRNGSNPQTGGVPQVVGLYRGGNGKVFGFVDGDNRFICGRKTEFEYPHNLSAIEWRNSKFERVDPSSAQVRDDASRHYFSKS